MILLAKLEKRVDENRSILLPTLWAFFAFTLRFLAKNYKYEWILRCKMECSLCCVCMFQCIFYQYERWGEMVSFENCLFVHYVFEKWFCRISNLVGMKNVSIIYNKNALLTLSKTLFYLSSLPTVLVYWTKNT